jgi:putative tricarboxylic transport membrane protein
MAPLIIGMILGPMAETSLRQALVISMGDYSTFLTRPISAVILAISAILLLLPLLRSRREGVPAG